MPFSLQLPGQLCFVPTCSKLSLFTFSVTIVFPAFTATRSIAAVSSTLADALPKPAPSSKRTLAAPEAMSLLQPSKPSHAAFAPWPCAGLSSSTLARKRTMSAPWRDTSLLQLGGSDRRICAACPVYTTVDSVTTASRTPLTLTRPFMIVDLILH
jgi:hypothetical protein